MQKLFSQLEVYPIRSQDTIDGENNSSSVYHLDQDIRKAEICLVNNELENQISNNSNLINDPQSTIHSSGDELSSCDLQSYVRSTDLNNLQMSRSYSSISAGSIESNKCSENSQIVSQLGEVTFLKMLIL